MNQWQENTNFEYMKPKSLFKFTHYTFCFEHPFTCIISGPTMSGKSYFVNRLIKLSNKKIYPPPDEIHYHYGVWQPLFDSMKKKVLFFKGLPELSHFTGEKKILIIIDDLMSEINSEISDFFTKGAHHLNLSVVYICQNLFHKNQFQRTINLNTQYLIIFKNPRDVCQIQYLGRSLLGNNAKEFEDIYFHATSRSYGYLVVNLRQTTPDMYRFVTYILDDHPKSSTHYHHFDVYLLNRYIDYNTQSIVQ